MKKKQARAPKRSQKKAVSRRSAEGKPVSKSKTAKTPPSAQRSTAKRRTTRSKSKPAPRKRLRKPELQEPKQVRVRPAKTAPAARKKPEPSRSLPESEAVEPKKVVLASIPQPSEAAKPAPLPPVRAARKVAAKPKATARKLQPAVEKSVLSSPVASNVAAPSGPPPASTTRRKREAVKAPLSIVVKKPAPRKQPVPRKRATRVALVQPAAPTPAPPPEAAEPATGPFTAEPPIRPAAEVPLALSVAPETKPSPMVPKPAPQPPAPFPFRIPPILLEGDEPPPPIPPAVCMPARPRDLAIKPEPEREPEGLPEADGTGTLLLTARDSHCLYAHWDLAREQQRAYTALAADGHLCLRMHSGTSPAVRSEAEIRVHPESQHWFIHVQNAGAKYVAELGYVDMDRTWVSIATSGPAETPVDAPSRDATFELASIQRHAPVTSSIPISQPFKSSEEDRAAAPASVAPQGGDLREAPPPSAQPIEPLCPALPEPRDVKPPSQAQPGPQTSKPAIQTHLGRSDARTHLPSPQARLGEVEARVVHVVEPGPREGGISARIVGVPETELASTLAWSEADDEALFHLIYESALPSQPLPASAEAAGAPARRIRAVPGLPLGISSAELPAPVPGAFEIPSPVSSGAVAQPVAPVEQPAEFWMNVNAELVIYGATEPDAAVSISGRAIRLRPDGTFSYRFSLPDGHYALNVRAVSTRGDRRAAKLGFSRKTERQGTVADHPQDRALRPPVPESVA